MKVFCHVPREDWIVDRLGLEFMNCSSHEVSLSDISMETDVIWLFASWCWNQIPVEILSKFKVLCTVHHEVPEKFDNDRRRNFLERDKYVDIYHTYTDDTKNLISKLSSKPVYIIPHWVNSAIWFDLDKLKVRNDLKLPKDKFIVGSFQRDTEGSDLKTPKLEKGPDIFLNVVEKISKEKDVHVLLGGWRRQYVIAGLEKMKVNYTYFEMPPQKIINKMYNACDLYVVGSRCEGGPQSLFECSITKTPIISTCVGQSKLILDNECIYDESLNNLKIDIAKKYIQVNSSNIEKFKISNHMMKYDSLIERLFNENL